MAGGRQRDAAATREAILRSARSRFATVGFDRSTVRAIAADAGVSPNLVTRYFGGKHGLFIAATDVDLHIVDVLPGPRSRLGRRIAHHTMRRWEDRPGNDPLLTMMRAAMSDATAAARMAEFFRDQAARPLADHLGTPDARERSAAVGALIMGTVVQRYVMATGPVATADRREVEDWLAHGLQHLLTGRALPSLTSPTALTATARRPDPPVAPGVSHRQ